MRKVPLLRASLVGALFIGLLGYRLQAQEHDAGRAGAFGRAANGVTR